MFSFVLRNALYVLLPYFTFEDDFMKFIVVKLKECYDHLLKKKPRGYIKGLSIEGTLLGAVQEVSSFDYIFQFFPPPNDNTFKTETPFDLFCLGTGEPTHSAGGIGMYIFMYIVHIICNAHARVIEAENSYHSYYIPPVYHICSTDMVLLNDHISSA